MRTRVILMILLLSLLQTTCAPKKNEYRYTLQKPDDSITASIQDSSTLFIISGPSGIGGARIIPVNGKWPKHIAFRFNYSNGQPYTSLESISLTTDHFQVKGSYKESGAMPYFLPDGNGRYDQTNPVEGTLDIKIKQNVAGLEIILPADLCARSNEVDIRWIDYYR